MNKTKLIIVEGLPGCSKSTTANMIAKQLCKNGEKVVCVDEGMPNHPADYDNYDFSDFETEREQILMKWQEFVETADEDTIYVFNCIFLQNPMCETMMRFGMCQEESSKYICEIAEIIRPMNPLILYIEQQDEKKTIDKVLNERGNDWLNAVIDYHINQEYGKSKGLSGFDGYIQCLEERKIREISILKTTQLNTIYLRDIITEKEFMELFQLAGLSCPTLNQIQVALHNTTKTFVLKQDEKTVAMISLLCKVGMHWQIKEFVVQPNYQGKMIGTILYFFAEKYIQSTIKNECKVSIEIQSSIEMHQFYQDLGFYECPNDNEGNRMEKIITND